LRCMGMLLLGLVGSVGASDVQLVA